MGESRRLEGEGEVESWTHARDRGPTRDKNKHGHFGTSNEKLTWSSRSTNGRMSEMDGSAIYGRNFQVDAK